MIRRLRISRRGLLCEVLYKGGHARRTRFYSAMIDSECLEKGKEYNEMPDVYIIYISEKDLWTAGKSIYKVEKKFKGTEISYDDGAAH